MTSLQPLPSEEAIGAFCDAFSASEFEFMGGMPQADCVLEFPGGSFGGRVEGRETNLELFRNVQAGFGGSLRFQNCCAMHQSRASAGEQIAEHWYTTGRTVTGGAYLNRGVDWFRLENGLVRDFLDFFDTEIVAAFLPSGQPATDFLYANTLFDRLRSIAPAEAVARLDVLHAGAEGGAV